MSNTYNRAVGVCKKRISPFDTVLDKMMEYSDRMVNCFKPKDKKTVIVITDYWDPKLFQQYEKKMLDYALNNGIWYIFLLVTDYGVTQIPFLPNSRNAFRDISCKSIEEQMTYKKMLMYLRGAPIVFTIRKTDPGIFPPGYPEEYRFDTKSLTWEKRDFPGDMSGRINKSALCQFLERVMWVNDCDSEDFVSKGTGCDDTDYSLLIFGKMIQWDGLALGKDGNEKIIALQDAIDSFIADCKKNVKMAGQ